MDLLSTALRNTQYSLMWGLLTEKHYHYVECYPEMQGRMKK